MMLRFEKPLARAAAFAGALWLTGCVEADKAGTPHLISFDLIDGTGAPVMRDHDAAVFTTSPRVTFVAVFDNLLDFSDIVNVDAGTVKPGLVTVTTAAASPTVDAVYTPNGHHKFTLIYAKGPNITASPSPGLPSAAAVTVSLNTALLKGQNAQPLVLGAVPASISFQTDPFSVTGEAADPMMPFGADHAFVLTASNITSADFASKVSVTSTTNMVAAAAEATVTASESDPAQFLVAPKSGMWPAGAKITITVAADAADQFGVALGAPATISYDVAAPVAAP